MGYAELKRQTAVLPSELQASAWSCPYLLPPISTSAGPYGILCFAELLQPITPAVRKQLEAHKIFVTARSLKSIDSSPTQTTGTGTTAVASQAGGTGLQLAELEQIKCLLLEALLASLPVVGSLGEWVLSAMVEASGAKSMLCSVC